MEFTTRGTASGYAIGRKALILDYITHSVALVIFPAPYFIVTHGSLHTNSNRFRVILSDCHCSILVAFADYIRTWWLMQALHAAVSLASGVGGGVGGGTAYGCNRRKGRRHCRRGRGRGRGRGGRGGAAAASAPPPPPGAATGGPHLRLLQVPPTTTAATPVIVS